MRWKIPGGVLLIVIMLLLSLQQVFAWMLLPLGFAVLYGVLLDDLKLSALFGFLFQLESYLPLLLFYYVSSSIIFRILFWGLGTALLGVISAWIRRNVRNKSLRPPTLRWKARVGVLLTGILILYYTTAFRAGGLWASLTFLFAVLYGVLSDDLKLSALFGFLFFLAFPLVTSLFYHEALASSLPYLLLWGLVHALLGGISVWIGRSALSE